MKTTKQGNYAVKRQERHKFNGRYYPECVIVYQRIDKTTYKPIKQIF